MLPAFPQHSGLCCSLGPGRSLKNPVCFRHQSKLANLTATWWSFNLALGDKHVYFPIHLQAELFLAEGNSHAANGRICGALGVPHPRLELHRLGQRLLRRPLVKTDIARAPGGYHGLFFFRDPRCFVAFKGNQGNKHDCVGHKKKKATARKSLRMVCRALGAAGVNSKPSQ